MIKKCSKCDGPADRPGQRYCRACHNAYQRERWSYASKSPEARAKDVCRSHANVYQKRGKIIPQPCEVCGTTSMVQKHHADYSRPLDVEWLCVEHHRERHGKQSGAAA
jgi:hypothetical protein